MRWEMQEGRRCAEVHANWRSGAALNQQEKRKKAGAIEGVKEGSEPTKIGKSPEGFSKSFFKVSFLGKNLGMFWGSFMGEKMYSEQKRCMGQVF